MGTLAVAAPLVTEMAAGRSIAGSSSQQNRVYRGRGRGEWGFLWCGDGVEEWFGATALIGKSRDCVAGRRDNPPHARMPEEERQVPEVMLDYAFVRRAAEEETLTILVMKDRESRAMRAWVMRHKGVCLEEAGERAGG